MTKPQAYFEVREFINLGFLMAQFTPEQLAPVIEEVRAIEANFPGSEKWNQNLAGQIRHEYKLPGAVPHLEQLITPFFAEYDKIFGGYIARQCPDPSKPLLFMKESWVNFQRKHEFNPPHEHLGIMSFVIWLQIPYTREQEMACAPGTEANMNVAGQFGFQYSNTLGDICSNYIPAYKDFEYRMLLFPARMKHLVAPFYSSDEFRISVSGNFFAR